MPSMWRLQTEFPIRGFGSRVRLRIEDNRWRGLCVVVVDSTTSIVLQFMRGGYWLPPSQDSSFGLEKSPSLCSRVRDHERTLWVIY